MPDINLPYAYFAPVHRLKEQMHARLSHCYVRLAYTDSSSEYVHGQALDFRGFISQPLLLLQGASLSMLRKEYAYLP